MTDRRGLPTAVRRGDVSRPDRASAALVGLTPQDQARIVLTGQTPRHTRKPCACGGVVRADRYAPAMGVAAHNRTRLHQDWRRESGKYDELVA